MRLSEEGIKYWKWDSEDNHSQPTFAFFSEEEQGEFLVTAFVDLFSQVSVLCISLLCIVSFHMEILLITTIWLCWYGT